VRIFFAVPRSAWVDLNLRRSLEDMGHELVRFDFPGWPDDTDPNWRQHGKPRTNDSLLASFRRAHRDHPIDLVFGYFYSSVAYPATIDEIKRSSVPTVNFSCNNVHQFDLVRDIAPSFDACIVPERSALPDFVSVGARPLRIQLAANPRVYRPLPEPRRYDVAFVGQRYADRAQFLDYLRRNGIDVRAWGAGWQPRKRIDIANIKAALALVEDERFDGVRRLLQRRAATTNGVAADTIDTSAYGGPRLLHRDLVRMFSQARISLGFATAGTSHQAAKRLTHLRLRDFEAPMSGALYVTERQPELEEYFVPGAEVLAYGDRAELLELVRHHLAHPEQAERIRRNAFLRSRREHTWQHRFDQLFAALGLR
jgi:spore maturation protein CgeB